MFPSSTQAKHSFKYLSFSSSDWYIVQVCGSQFSPILPCDPPHHSRPASKNCLHFAYFLSRAHAGVSPQPCSSKQCLSHGLALQSGRQPRCAIVADASRSELLTRKRGVNCQPRWRPAGVCVSPQGNQPRRDQTWTQTRGCCHGCRGCCHG